MSKISSIEVEPTCRRKYRYPLIEEYRKYMQNEVAQYIVRTTTLESIKDGT